ncbi:MAG: Maf family protein, partial [Bacteroidales bacterium]|nr:Maf family protein [Bacteroidales bacterium]
MAEVLSQLLKDKKVILGSASPRRRELMQGLGIEFTVDTGNNFEETVPANMEITLVPEYMAKGKSDGFHRELSENEILITAD